MAIAIETTDERIDQPIKITLTGLSPRSRVTVRAQTQDQRGNVWHSHAIFKAERNGIVDVSTQASLGGTYSGIDPMGLIWSMRSQENPITSPYVSLLEKPMEWMFTAHVNGTQVAEQKIARMVLLPSIEKHEINEPEVKGVCFVPKGTERLPAVLLCSGSSGGIASQLTTAALLASHGYVTFVLAYFNYPGLPQTLYDVPLETFQKGVEWLRRHPRVDGDRIALRSISKGAEGILAAAAHLALPIRGIVAISPSNVVWQGIGRGKPEPRSSWTLNGKSLPFVSMNSNKIIPQFMRARVARWLRIDRLWPALTRFRLRSVYNGYRTANPDQVIPVERIRAPLLLLSGADDQTWPASGMSRAILKRRQHYKVSFSDESKDFQCAGHSIQFPYRPTTISYSVFPKMALSFGGNPKANARANEHGWACALRFLKASLISRLDYCYLEGAQRYIR